MKNDGLKLSFYTRVALRREMRGNFFFSISWWFGFFAVFLRCETFNFWNYEEIFLFDGGVVGGADGAGAMGNRNLASNYC